MNYKKYTLCPRELLIYGAIYFLIISTVSYLFYYSFIPILLFSPGILVYFKYLRNVLKQRQDKNISLQFKDFINTISSLLSTGYSLENAIAESRKELYSIHGNSIIITELDQMIKKLALHISPEEIFTDFASRTDIEDIKNFAEILSIAKQTGGDLIHIILSTSSSISARIELRRDIDTAISGRKYELLVMSFMPILIMLYIKLTQPDFFNPVYGNMAGIMIMSLCLIIYGSAIVSGCKIISS